MPAGTGEAGAGWNSPVPLPSKTVTSVLPTFAVSRSRLPSPSRSQTTTSAGCVPVANGDPLEGAYMGTWDCVEQLKPAAATRVRQERILVLVVGESLVPMRAVAERLVLGSAAPAKREMLC